MTELFLTLLNMSLTASWLILAVVLLRLLLRRAPKSLRMAMWALVGVRLALPVSFESAFSLIPSARTISPQIIYADTPVIHSGIAALNELVNPVISAQLAPAAGAEITPAHSIAGIAAIVWTAGAAAIALYGAVSYARLRSRVADAVRREDGSFVSEAVRAPFVMGLLRPRIYLPPRMSDSDRACVLAHERAHVARGDAWAKLTGFLFLSVYWFNPLTWAAYILMCRDIELAADERAIRDADAAAKKAYAGALLAQSSASGVSAVCPLAFGALGVRQRIKNVLCYKKPAFWLIIAAVAAVAVCAVCFLTNPKGAPPAYDGTPLTELPEGYSLDDARRDGCVISENLRVTGGREVWDAFTDAALRGESARVRMAYYYTLGDPSHYDAEYYEEIKDTYPRLYIADLIYDGNAYTIEEAENGGLISRSFKYLVRYEGAPSSPSATYTSAVRWVLVNDRNVTWQQIERGMLSSQHVEWIAHYAVYTDLIG